MVIDSSTDVRDIAHEAAIDRALGQFDRNEGDVPLQVQSNIDDKIQLISMIDGLPRPPIPRIHAKRVLSKTLADGSPAFWIPGMPGEPPEPEVGSIKCMLHPEFDESDGPAGFGREFLEQIGYAGRRCNRGNPDKPNRADFQSVLDRDMHMASKHSQEWRAIQAGLETRERRQLAEERRLDREAMLELAKPKRRTRKPVESEEA